MRKLLVLSMITLWLLGCSNGDSSDPQPPVSGKEPKAVGLLFPLNNSECLTGAAQGSLSTVEFRWQGGENDSFELILEDLTSNQVETHITRNARLELALKRNNPYQWYVISRIDGQQAEAKSDEWKFYTEGEAVENYAPFPADLISPEDAFTVSEPLSSLRLEWSGSDIDNDELHYDVLTGTDAETLSPLVTGLTESYHEISIEEGAILYWQIRTVDSQGNKSYSKIRNIRSEAGSPILGFTVSGAGETYEATVDNLEKNIVISLGNFDYKKLSPIINLAPGYSINPASGTELNFEDDLFFDLTGPDGSIERFNLSVISGQHEIHSFEVAVGSERYIGVVDSDAATISIEMGNFDYSNVNAEVEPSFRASVAAQDITNMDLTAPSQITVVSEAGTSKSYTVSATLGMSQVYSYFRNPGFEFDTAPVETGYQVFAGSTQYVLAGNIQDLSAVEVLLVDSGGTDHPAEVFRSQYFHQHSFDSSQSTNNLTVVIPDDLAAGTYTLSIREGDRRRDYPQRLLVINDNRVVRITGINQTDFTRGDTLVLTGENLKKTFAVKSNGNIYLFNEYVNELTVNPEGTELRLYFSTNVYGRLKSWGATNEKPLAIQTQIEGYPHELNSNIVYFNVN